MTAQRTDRQWAPLVVLLAMVFVARWVISTRESYWFDELLSVAIYGVNHDSVVGAVKYLARESIHPPLYQIVLYGWMRVLGTDEAVTRSLSNLYMTGASLCVYLIARSALGQRRALMATLFFSLMGQPFYFAMETRSYAQSLFLVTLSSLILLRLVRRRGAGETWRALLRSRGSIAFVLVNIGLLMTHYYNAFFLGAQACFALTWSLRREWLIAERKPARRVVEALGLAGYLASPLVLQLALWGPVMATSYQKRADDWEVAGAATNPFEAIAQIGVQSNFGKGTSAWLLVSFGVLALLFYAARTALAVRKPVSHGAGSRVLAWYALATTIIPFLLAYAIFAYSGHERYVRRYFMFIAPSLAIILVLAIDHAVMLVQRAAPQLRAARRYLQASLVAALAVAIVLILPGTYRYATLPKEDWRGLTERIVDLTAKDPKHRYALYATGFDQKPLLDYYLERQGTSLRPSGYLTRNIERSKKKKAPIKAKALKDADFLIVAFTRLGPSKYPKTLKRLKAKYEVHQRLLHDDWGLIVYRVKG